MEQKTILGLNVGTQLMGLALIRGRSLEDWKVKNFEGAWSKIKQKVIVSFIERYLKRYSVSSIRLKIPEACRSSPAVEKLIEALKKLCERERLPIGICTISDLKKAHKAASKADLMHLAANLYPELYHVFQRAKEVKRIYYSKIFEAALAATL